MGAIITPVLKKEETEAQGLQAMEPGFDYTKSVPRAYAAYQSTKIIPNTL